MPDTTGLVAALNAARAAENLPALTENASLGDSAQGWACGMAESGAMSHGDFQERLLAAVGDKAGGECIAEGRTDAASAVRAWLDDPPHRQIMLGDYDAVGVGSFASTGGTVYWCADFARLGDSAGALASPDPAGL